MKRLSATKLHLSIEKRLSVSDKQKLYRSGDGFGPAIRSVFGGNFHFISVISMALKMTLNKNLTALGQKLFRLVGLKLLKARSKHLLRLRRFLAGCHF